MKTIAFPALMIAVLSTAVAFGADGTVVFSGERKENNLVSKLLEVASISGPRTSYSFSRPRDGWIFFSAECQGSGAVTVVLDDAATADAVINHHAADAKPAEGVRYVKQGEHQVHVACEGAARVERLVGSGHLIRDGSRIALTSSGRLLLDSILGEIASTHPISAVSSPQLELEPA